MKVLIIPDLHHRVDQADTIIRKVKADKVICLGDVYDDFDDTPEMVRNTSEWFVDFINQPNHIYIAGNHCLHYAFPNKSFQCSGYTQWKYFQINDIVSRKDWDKMVYYHVLDGKWLLTHAGLHKRWVPKEIAALHVDRPKFLASLAEYLDQEIIKGHRGESWIFGPGLSRGGFQPVGGISWCDYTCEFYPVKGLNQICGHTPQSNHTGVWTYLKGTSKPTHHPINAPWAPNPKDYDDVQRSYNVCLDVWQNTHWAIWNGTNLRFGNMIDAL
jgi:hypothetical protein